MKKLYLAIDTETIVNQAATDIYPEKIVKTDLSRDAVFILYDELSEVVLFENVIDARSYSRGITSPNFFNDMIYPCTDKSLLSTYGEDNVWKKRMIIPIIYEVEIEDESILQKRSVQESKLVKQNLTSYIVSEENKSKIKLNYATTCTTIYATDEYAKANKSPATVDLVAKPGAIEKAARSCVIL